MNWRDIWLPREADADTERALNASFVKHWISGGLFLNELLGDWSCGIVALEAYFSDTPEVTAEYISQRLHGHISEDTARRKLKAMTKAGSLTTRKSGRTVYYRLDSEVAEATIAFMKGETVRLPAQPQLAGNSAA